MNPCYPITVLILQDTFFWGGEYSWVFEIQNIPAKKNEARQKKNATAAAWQGIREPVCKQYTWYQKTKWTF